MHIYSNRPLTQNEGDQLKFLIVRTCSKWRTPGGSNHSSSNIIDCRFSTNGILLRSGEAEMKIAEIKAGSLSWCLFTRLLSGGSLCSLLLAHATHRWACLQATSMIMTTLLQDCYTENYLLNSCTQNNDKNLWTKKVQLTQKLLKVGQDVVKNCHCFLVIFQLSFNKLKKR